MHPRKRILFYLFVIICTASLWAQNSDVQESQKGLTALLPNPFPAQAVPQSERTFYGPKALYEYMDGGAESFLAYDFRMLLHQDLRARDIEISVDLFDMGSREDAFGMYSSERSPRYHFIKVGTEGYDNEGILNFFQGRYYVKLAGFGTGADELLREFAGAISGRITDKPLFPDLLERFPAENRKPHSEQYFRKDPLGHPFLSPAYTATYGSGEEESKLLLSVAHDAVEAQQRLKLLADHFRSTGRCDAAPDLGEGAIRGSNSFEGSFIACAKGRYIVLLINPAAGSERAFQQTLANLD